MELLDCISFVGVVTHPILKWFLVNQDKRAGPRWKCHGG